MTPVSAIEPSIATSRAQRTSTYSDAPATIEKMLNELAREGWQLKSLTATQVKGRIGPGATEGLFARVRTFPRSPLSDT